MSTASRALNGYPDITEATRRSVEAVAARLGYRAHATARSLRVGDAGVVAAIIDPESLHPAPGTINYFWSLFLSEVMANLGDAGYSLLTVMHSQAPKVLGQLPYDAAMVLSTRRHITDVIEAVPFGVPLVTAAGREDLRRPQMTIGHDYAAAVKEVLDHLVEVGCRRPALVVPAMDHTFVDAMTSAANQHPSAPLVVVTSDAAHTIADLAAADCDGLFMVAADSIETVRLLQETTRPMRLVVMSDSRVNPYLKPAVSTLSFLPIESARRTVAALQMALRGGHEYVELPHVLTPRQSSLG